MVVYRSLRSGREFAATLRAGSKAAVPGLALSVAPGRPGQARLGLAVKAASAVRRNRIKRRLRAAFRAAAPTGTDIVARADERLNGRDFQEMVELFRRAHAKVGA